MAEELFHTLVVEAQRRQLPEDDHRPLGVQQVVEQCLGQTVVVDGGDIAVDDTLLWQLWRGELKERLAEGHVDMHARVMVGGGIHQCLID